MKLIRKVETDDYKEITVIKSYVFFSREITYRKINGWMFIYKGDNNYKCLGYLDSLLIEPYFDLKLNYNQH